MLIPRKSASMPASVYGAAFRSSWEQIDALHEQDASLPFRPDRHHLAIAAIRSSLFEALERPLTQRDYGTIAADYARAEFLAHAVDAIVHAPTLSIETEDFFDWHRSLALQLHYAAARALATIIKAGTLRTASANLRGSAVGITNELVPTALINRQESRVATPSLMLLGSHVEDSLHRTDLKYIRYQPELSIDPIQVKTSHNASGRAPDGGYKIYANDFHNDNHFIAYALVSELAHPLGRQVTERIDQATDRLGAALARKKDNLTNPTSRAPRAPHRPSGMGAIKNTIGMLHPELSMLRDNLLFDSLNNESH